MPDPDQENEVSAGDTSALRMALDVSGWGTLRRVLDCVMTLVTISGDNDAVLSVDAAKGGVCVTVKVTVPQCFVEVSHD